MWKIFVGILCFGGAFGQLNWVNLGRVPYFTGYMSRVMQELVYDVEKLEWCNLRMTGYAQALDETLYQRRIVGNVTYSNGFVVSIQDLDLTDFASSVTNGQVNGEATPFATVRARLNMRNVRVGFDVTVDLVDPEPPYTAQEKFTGHYTHPLLQVQMDVTKNLISKEITSSPDWTSITAGSGIRMIYMPANNLTEVLSRRYLPSSNADSVTEWCRNIFGPKIMEIATNRVHFPELCFLNCPS